MGVGSIPTQATTMPQGVKAAFLTLTQAVTVQISMGQLMEVIRLDEEPVSKTGAVRH